MFSYYQLDNQVFCSRLPCLALPKIGQLPPGSDTCTFLFSRPPHKGRTSFAVSEAFQLFEDAESPRWLDTKRHPAASEIPRQIEELIRTRRLRALNIAHPCWRECALPLPAKKRLRLHLLAAGDVGGTLLTGLRLLGADVLCELGICDINENAARRWAAELGQISYPWAYDAMPDVRVVPVEELFDCDVFVFCASRGVPPVGSSAADVRMAQWEANAQIAAEYARMARKARFRGFFAVVSDPVDLLCKKVFLESNTDENGEFDGNGLFAGQIEGFGLGVMNARAAYYAKADARFSQFLSEGRAFGPHGQNLVIANSIEHYDDALSRELTALATGANQEIRALGYKPFVAPALSSGALSLLLALRGEWHYGATLLGDVFFGAKTRHTPAGPQTETAALPDALFSRIEEAADALRAVL